MTNYIKFLIPDLIIESIYDIPLKFIKKKKIKGIIFDIDNTLVADGIPSPDQKLISYLKDFEKNGIKIALVSNNSKNRVDTFNKDLGFFARYESQKPKKKALEPVLENFGFKKREILLVGDQLFTDVLTARLNKIRVILVKPINKNKENVFFRLKRMVEKPFIRFYYYKKKMSKTGESIEK